MRLPYIGRLNRRAWTTIGGGSVAFVCLVAVVVSNLAIHANAGVPAVPSKHVRHALLSAAVPRALGHAHLLGREDGTLVLNLSISLRLRNPQALDVLIKDQQNPKSPQYHHYLTPQSFLNTYGPTSASVAAVRGFLESSGLRVTRVSSNRMLVDASGTVAQIEKAFGVTIGRYQLGKRTVYGPERSPAIPDALAATILNVGGLDNVGQMQPLLVRAPSAPHAAALSGPVGGYSPTNLRNAYDVSTLISNGGDGTGQRVAVVELAPYIASDVATYRSQYSLPSATINGISVDSAPVTGDDQGTLEADLDLEVVSALAPNATQDVYVAPNTMQGMNDLFTQIGTDNQDTMITTSWGLCEPYMPTGELQTLDNIFRQITAQGQNIFAAAGDSGSDDCGTGGLLPPSVDSPASDPNVVAVGGTTLTLSSTSGYGSETAWNDGPAGGGGGGGGMSASFSPSPFQSAANMPNTGYRPLPDVAADADPNTGYATYCTSTSDTCPASGWLIVGGTSAAAPLWAGLLSDVNTYLAQTYKNNNNTGISSLGMVYADLYEWEGNPKDYPPFHDVLLGTNDIDYSGTAYAGDYPAGQCYDMVTGVGTPDAWNIARYILETVWVLKRAPCPPPTIGNTQLVQDSGFDNTPSGWQQYSLGEYNVIAPDNPHSGGVSFFACAYPNCDDRVWQTINVPTTVTGAQLSFWLDGANLPNIVSPGTPCLDHFTVTLAKPDGTVFDTVQAACALNTQGYVQESFYLTSVLQQHEGETIILMFRGTTSNVTPFPGYYSFWFVDDVWLMVS